MAPPAHEPFGRPRKTHQTKPADIDLFGNKWARYLLNIKSSAFFNDVSALEIKTDRCASLCAVLTKSMDHL
jgi:hypothetical protein